MLRHRLKIRLQRQIQSVAADLHLPRQTGKQVLPLSIGGYIFLSGQSTGHRALDLLCGAQANSHIVLLSQELDNLRIQVVAPDFQGLGLAHSALADYSHVHRAAAQVNHKGAGGLHGVDPGTKGSTQRFLHQAHGTGTGVDHHGHNGALLHIRVHGRHRHHHTRLKQAVADHFIDKMAHHLLGQLIVTHHAGENGPLHTQALRLAPL